MHRATALYAKDEFKSISEPFASTTLFIMSTWRRFHIDETIKAMAVSDSARFFVFVREPPGANRQPRECYRSDLKSAQETADGIVQSYYPHDCGETNCGIWQKLET
jgi:hypothetical protein